MNHRIASRDGIDLVRWPALEPMVDVAITTRAGGVSEPPYDTLNLGLHVGDDPAAVVENRRRAAHAFGVALDDLVFCNQVHGDTIMTVDAAHRGRGTTSMVDVAADADAMVTTDETIVLAVLVADCVPIALVDPGAGVLGVVHAGWPGTTRRLAEAAVAAMTEHGAHPGAIRAVIGPSVSPRTYQVGADVAEAIAAHPDLGGSLGPDGTGRWLLDVAAANRTLLRAAGVPDDHILGGDLTTTDARFYSHRARRPTGRFALLARLGRVDA